MTKLKYIIAILLLITLQLITCKKLQKFTHDELYHYNGVTSPLIYVACKEYIYDVSDNKISYGVNGRYPQYVC